MIIGIGLIFLGICIVLASAINNANSFQDGDKH